MGVIVALLAILGYGLLLNRIIKWQIESALASICASLICLLYISGLLGLLQIAAQAILIIGVLLFIAEIFTQWKRGLILQIITPGVLFFLLSTIGLWILTRSEYYSNFVFVDDFSHWGRVPKIIADNNRLVVSTDTIWFQDYPPGMALFDYLFLQLSGFNRNIAMFSQGIFIIAACAQFFSVIPKAVNRYTFFAVSMFIYSLIYFFGAGFHTLSVDLIVGVVFGVALLGYLADRQKGKLASVLRLVPLVMVFPLIKLIGILFSFVIVGVVLCDLLLGSTTAKERIKLAIAVLILGAACLISYVSWDVHVKSMGISKTFNTEITIGDVAKALAPATATERQKATIDNFIHRVFLPHPESKISRNYYWFALCLAFVGLLWHMGNDFKSRVQFVPFVVLFGGFCAYLMVFLVLYMFFFGAYEGARLASFDRYVNTYLVGVLIVLFGMSLSQYFKGKRDRTATISFITICLLVMLPNLKAEFYDLSHVIKGQPDGEVENVAKYWQEIQNKTYTNSRIYFIWQGSNGTENTIFDYGIMPRTHNQGCWSVGEPYNNGDVWTCRMTTSEFEHTLMDYDYLLIAHADKKFADRFLLLFGSVDTQDGSLLQIVKENNHLSLHKI